MVSPTPRVRSGLDVVVANPPASLEGLRLGLIVHPASVTARLEHAVDALRRRPELRVAALFGPQHGARGDKQDNMIESEPFVDPRTGLPVHSLYGAHRRPTAEMLRGLDALVFDLQDVGTRVYTFVWTMVLAMQACREHGLRFVVLDRPNPIGGILREGTLLRDGYQSFVGLHRIPLRHALTAGELARLANAEMEIGCDLEVVPCEGWSRHLWFDETGLPWVMPSPNLPTLDSCAVFPGLVLLEGTNLSEGRGTTRPFELFGAPYLDPHALEAALLRFELPGVAFRACWFEPTFQKHAGLRCGGAQLHVTDRDAFRPVETALAILRAARDLAPRDFAWREPPYEYERVRPPIDILWGGDDLRLGIESGATPREILASGAGQDAAFAARCAPHLLPC